MEGFEGLAREFRDFETSPQRCLVLTGAGGHFSSGVDVGASLLGRSTAENTALMRRLSDAALALFSLSKPTVAAVDGIVMGAAMNLAVGCDVVLCTPGARFAEIFVRRGLSLDLGGSWLLPRLVGPAMARDLALTGREVDGHEAVRIGLASRLVDAAVLEEEAGAVAAGLAEGAPLAQQMTKKLLARSPGLTFEQALGFENQVQGTLLASEDVGEALDAFREKRSPRFQGR